MILGVGTVGYEICLLAKFREMWIICEISQNESFVDIETFDKF